MRPTDSTTSCSFTGRLSASARRSRYAVSLDKTASSPSHRRGFRPAFTAFDIEPDDWQEVTWREGTNAALRSHFARARVRAAHRDHERSELRERQWLLIEWPEGHDEPLKYGLSTLPEDTPLQRMVFEARMRWRIERDDQDLKQDLGLGQYEGRG
jgi:SRSO17 transposase